MSFVGDLFKFVLVLVLLAAAAYGGYFYGQMALQESLFEVNVPINQTFDFELNQVVDIPIKTVFDFPFSDSFLISENVPINTFIDLDEMIRIPLNLPTGNITIDVPIKKRIPINTSINVYKLINISKNISLNVDKQISFNVRKNISVPVNMEVLTKVPVPDWMRKE